MAIAMDIDVNVPQTVGAPTITVTELKQKVQEYVNSLYVRVIIPQANEPAATRRHSLSSLRGICKSGLSDKQALNEYLSEKF